MKTKLNLNFLHNGAFSTEYDSERKVLFTCGRDGFIKVVEVENEVKEVADVMEEEKFVDVKLLSKDLLIVGCESGNVKLYKLECSGNKITGLSFDSNVTRFTLSCNTIACNDKVVVLGSENGKLKVVEKEGLLQQNSEEEKMVEYEGHKGAVVCVCVDPKNEYFVSVGRDGFINMWDLLETKLDSASCCSPPKKLERFILAIPKQTSLKSLPPLSNNLSTSPSQNFFAVIPNTKKLLFHEKKGEGFVKFREMELKEEAESCYFDSEGKLLAICEKQGKVNVWKSDNWRENAPVHLRSFVVGEPVKAVHFFPSASPSSFKLFISTFSGNYTLQEFPLTPSSSPSSSPFSKQPTPTTPQKQLPPNSSHTSSKLSLPSPSKVPLKSSSSENSLKTALPSSSSSFSSLHSQDTPLHSSKDLKKEEIKLETVEAPHNSPQTTPTKESLPVSPKKKSLPPSHLKEDSRKHTEEAMDIGDGEENQRKEEKSSERRHQECFQSSSTPLSKKKRYLVWNLIGNVRNLTERWNQVIEVKFANEERYSNLTLRNDVGYTMAALSETSLVLASKRNKQAKIKATFFHQPLLPSSSLSFHHKWSKSLHLSEDILSISSGDGWVAVCTSKSYCRMYSSAGVEGMMFSVGGRVLSSAGCKKELSILYEAGGSVRVKMLRVKEELVKELRDVVVCGSSEEEEEEEERWVTWMGYNQQLETLVMVDSEGVARSFYPKTNLFVPVLELKENKPFLWPIGFDKDHLIAVQLKENQDFPRVGKNSSLSRVPLCVPLASENSAKIVGKQLVVSQLCVLSQQKEVSSKREKELQVEIQKEIEQLDKLTLTSFLHCLSKETKLLQEALYLFSSLKTKESMEKAIQLCHKKAAPQHFISSLQHFLSACFEHSSDTSPPSPSSHSSTDSKKKEKENQSSNSGSSNPSTPSSKKRDNPFADKPKATTSKSSPQTTDSKKRKIK